MAGSASVLGGSEAGAVFSVGGLSSLLTIQFWKYAIFYIAVFISGMHCAFAFWGWIMDKNDFEEFLNEQLKEFDNEELKEIG